MKKYLTYKASGLDWLGEIPCNWGIISLKHLVKIKITDGPHETPNAVEDGIPFVSAEAVQNHTINFDSKWGYITKEDHLKYSKKCKPENGDIFIVKSGATTGKVAYVDTNIEFNIWSPLALVRADEKSVYSRYLFNFIISPLFQEQVQFSWSFGTQQNIGMGVIQNLQIITPPLPEQLSIVRFLDYKTGQIDRFVASRQKQVELLKEQKAAIINKAVTKGINPNAKMKPSGIEWLEEVPEHWKKLRLKNLTTRITNGFVGSTSNILKESGVRYIQALHVKQNTIIFNVPYYVGEDWSNDHPRSILKEGDIVITQTGAMTGDVGLVPKEFAGCNCHALIIVKSDQRKVIPAYLLILLASKFGNSLLESIRTGSMHPHLNSTIVCDINLSIPEEIKEQQAILDFINTEISTIDSLISKYQKQIDLMQEYRTSLISQAVTGKIDVRDWQPKARKYPTEELPISIAAEK